MNACTNGRQIQMASHSGIFRVGLNTTPKTTPFHFSSEVGPKLQRKQKWDQNSRKIAFLIFCALQKSNHKPFGQGGATIRSARILAALVSWGRTRRFAARKTQILVPKLETQLLRFIQQNSLYYSSACP